MLGNRLNLLDGLNLFDHEQFLVGFHPRVSVHIQLLLNPVLNVVPVRRNGHLWLLMLGLPMRILVFRSHGFWRLGRILLAQLRRGVVTAVPLLRHLPDFVQGVRLLLVKILVALLEFLPL